VKPSDLVSDLADRLRRIEAEVFKLAPPPSAEDDVGDEDPVVPEDEPIAQYDRRIHDDKLRTATRSRFETYHYADAVESGSKALNECVRSTSGSIEDGDGLMTSVFSEKNPKLRINNLKSQSDKSEQRGHMLMCQGVVAAWRNPRAHSSQLDDDPATTIAMLEHIQHLMAVTRASTRTRRRKK
jgi:uncharacterized protein (TIGR02391 family)